MSSSFDSNLNLVNLFYFNNHNNHPLDLLVGEIIIWPTNSNYPKGFLLCDGTSYSTTEYSELYAIIGTTYGSGSGTFKVPDISNKHIRSGTIQSNNIQVGGSGGNNTIVTNNLPSHTHNISNNVSNWTEYDVNTTIVYNISDLVIPRPNVTNNHTNHGQFEAKNGSRLHGSHEHNLAYSTNNISGQYADSDYILSKTNFNYINSANFTGSYSTQQQNIDSTYNFSGNSSYVPKSKKVYYLIYSGKH